MSIATLVRWGRKLLNIILLNALIFSVFTAHRSYKQTRNRESLAIRTSDGIDEGRFININGVEQWVRIRGEDRENPVILYLHGGPGAASSLFTWQYFARWGWEKSFTIVHWDQPGAGRTYAKAGKKIDPALTMTRISHDGIEVAKLIRSELRKDKIILVGTSWGSALGVQMIRLRPDLFYAYVASAQVTDKERDEAVAYEQVLAKARQQNNSSAITELEALGPPPYVTAQSFRVQRKWARHFEGLPGNMTTLIHAIYTPGVGLGDFINWVSALEANEKHFRNSNLSDDWSRFDIRSLGRNFSLPLFFFQGADDDIAPLRQVQNYYEWIHAPQKQLIPIEGGGHSVDLLKGDIFLDLLKEHVRPLASEETTPPGSLPD